MNLPAVIAIPIRIIFVLGVIVFFAGSFVVACLGTLYNAVMDQ